MQLWKIAVVWIALKTKEAMAYSLGRGSGGEGNLRVCCFSKLQPKAVEGLKQQVHTRIYFSRTPNSLWESLFPLADGGGDDDDACIHPSIHRSRYTNTGIQHSLLLSFQSAIIAYNRDTRLTETASSHHRRQTMFPPWSWLPTLTSDGWIAKRKSG